jgi:putative hydrolase of the HAD superfamily
MSKWLLCDYGEVLCLAPPQPDWDILVGLAVEAGWGEGGSRHPSEEFRPVFWQHRLAYDRGDLTALDYWTATLGRAPGADLLRALIGADQAIWLHPNQASLDAARRSAGRGYQLAVLSNAPREVATEIDRLPWLDGFEPRFFSCYLNRVKPEPAAYQAVLEGLGASADEVVFFDDRPANVDAAKRLGLDARLFTDPAQLDL